MRFYLDGRKKMLLFCRKMNAYRLPELIDIVREDV